VNLTLGLSSENTALPDPHYYHHKVESLPTGESASVRFEFDLWALEQTATSPPAAPEPSYKILRISTTTAGGDRRPGRQSCRLDPLPVAPLVRRAGQDPWHRNPRLQAR
jgi:hypothetical protein